MYESVDWKKKLTSRKFWAAVCSLVTQIIVAFGGTEDQTVKITALIMAGATVIAYIIGEGLVDASNKNTIPIEYILEEEYDDEDAEAVPEEE